MTWQARNLYLERKQIAGASALVVAKVQIAIAHVEAGLRGLDRSIAITACRSALQDTAISLAQKERGGAEEKKLLPPFAERSLKRPMAARLKFGLLAVFCGGGDGKQTRSFLYIDECIEGTLRVMRSDFIGPVNIGSEEMVTINRLAEMVMEIAGKKLQIRHVPGPLGNAGAEFRQQTHPQKIRLGTFKTIGVGS